MQLKRSDILKSIRKQIASNHHIIGVASGAGISAKYAARGGADLVLALNSGRFRQMGVGSVAGFMPFANSNKMVEEFATREIIPIVPQIPVIFGLCATDPTLNLDCYLDKLMSLGFSGVNNYPSVGLIDGQFKEAIEEEGYGYNLEVAAIAKAHQKDIFTIAFVFDVEQAKKMAAAKADVVCAHFGFTKGGVLSGKNNFSVASAASIAKDIFDAASAIHPEVIKLIYGGPIFEANDLQYIYDHTQAHGYIGGSTFERIPSEKAIMNTTKDFKSLDQQTLIKTQPVYEKEDYVSFIKDYIETNYQHKVTFQDLVKELAVSRSTLSDVFNKVMGMSFPEYISQYRVFKAIKIMENNRIALKEVAHLVGFSDYVYFSKVFKKITGLSPKEYAYNDKIPSLLDSFPFK